MGLKQALLDEDLKRRDTTSLGALDRSLRLGRRQSTGGDQLAEELMSAIHEASP